MVESKVYYYFCDACGCDTAAYEIYHTCPYCRDSKQKLHLMATSDTTTIHEVREAIQQARTQWIATHSQGQHTRTHKNSSSS